MIIAQGITFDLSLITEDGTMIAFVGYLVVFVALVLLYTVFNNLPKLLKLNFRSSGKKESKKELKTAKEGLMDMDISGETNAAIGTAIHLFFNEMHDEENLTLTINRVSKRYTPWSSKIYGVVRNLNRRF
ncbi:MAG: OadG family transporter subunit [Candidatus Cyclobacteriaceae bacterium M3_2C_046]